MAATHLVAERETLLRVSSPATTVLYRGAARSIAFGRDVGWVNEGRWGEAIGRINLRNGKVTPVLTGPRYMSRLVLRPDGLALASQVWGGGDVTSPGGHAVTSAAPAPHRR